MLFNKLPCQLLVMAMVVVLYAFSATAQQPRIESLEANDNKVLVKVTGVTDEKKLLVRIGGKSATIVGSSTQPDGLLSFEVEVPLGITPGPATVTVKYEDKPIGSQVVNIPHPLGDRGKQPEIFELKPVGGIEGATITIVGKNLGGNLNQVTIWLEKREEKDGERIFTKIEEPVIPLSLSEPDERNHQQELKFAIPLGHDLAGKHFFSNIVRLRVIVDGQPSNYVRLTAVRSNWRTKTALLAGLLMVVLLVLLGLVVRKLNFLKVLFVEKKTNTYSLSKCQAFAWTVILIGSYFYLAIGRGVILGKGTIPDFNPSLLWLMGISYAAMLGARRLSVRVPKNDLAATPLRLSNLISEGGEISLPRLQLVGFTICAILIYVYYLSSANLFVEGLPNIPPTLLYLLGISQSGYIGGKMLGGRLAVNYVVPRRAQLGRENVNLTIIGSGLLANTKVLFQDHPQLIDTQFLNSNSLSVKLPKLSQAGWKQLVLIPPTGSSIVLDEVIEVVDAKIENLERVPSNSRQVKLTLKGFNLQEIQATIAGKPATTVSMDEANNLLTLEAEADIETGANIKITSVDEQLEDGMKVPSA